MSLPGAGEPATTDADPEDPVLALLLANGFQRVEGLSYPAYSLGPLVYAPEHGLEFRVAPGKYLTVPACLTLRTSELPCRTPDEVADVLAVMARWGVLKGSPAVRKGPTT